MLFKNQFFNMHTSMKKIENDKDVKQSVVQALADLKDTHQELKNDLKDLHIKSANLIDVPGNRKAVVIHFPYRLKKRFWKNHTQLVRELEKKFSGKDVFLIATRRKVRPPKNVSAAERYQFRIHRAMLKDIVHPVEIVGMVCDHRPDGSEICMIQLDQKARNDTENKLETFRRVYWTLTGKSVYFDYYDTSFYKIRMGDSGEPTKLELLVAQALADLKDTHQELKNALKDLYINSAKLIYVSRNRKAVLIQVPYLLRKGFRKIHTMLITELEKKFSGKDVVLVVTRRKDGSRTQRAMLKDIVHPAKIVRSSYVHEDGFEMILLNSNARNDVDTKLDTFSRVYWELFEEDVYFRYDDTES